MDAGTIGPSKPQTLTLVDTIQENQHYIPVGEAQKIYSNHLLPSDLSDHEISRLVEQVGDNTAIIRDTDKHYVLVEGVLHKFTPELDGDLIVAIKYDFARKSPLIEVPGFYSSMDFENGGFQVRLLTAFQSIRFVEDILLKNHRQAMRTIFYTQASIKFGLEIQS